MVPPNLKPAVARLWQRYYPTYDEAAFIGFVTGMVQTDMSVLEIGAGSGRGAQAMFALKGLCERYVGIDLDPRVLENPNLDEAYVCDADRLPFEDGRFDLVFHRFVAEHLQNPEQTFRESLRVLKPGGSIVFATPNRLYYPMILAQLTPTWVHEFLVAHLGTGRKSADVFPTFYRLNTKRRIKQSLGRLAPAAAVEIYRVSAPPGYLRKSPLLFALGILYERSFERVFPTLRAGLWTKITK